MKIRPLQDRLIVKRVAEENKTKGGIIIPDTAKEKPLEGKVIAVGNGKVLEDGKTRPLDIKAEQGRHCALANRHSPLHRLSANFEETCRIADRDRARRGQRRIFAERMSRHKGNIPCKGEAALRFENANHCKTRRHQRRLSVFGQGKVAFRPFEHQARQIL